MMNGRRAEKITPRNIYAIEDVRVDKFRVLGAFRTRLEKTREEREAVRFNPEKVGD